MSDWEGVDAFYAGLRDASPQQLAARLHLAYGALRDIVLDAADDWTDEQDRAELEMTACLAELHRRAYALHAVDAGVAEHWRPAGEREHR